MLEPPKRRTATLTLEAARRIALGAQGFGRPPSRRAPTTREYASVLARLGLIQLDAVNVCTRSHYLPFYARIGAYDRRQLDSWLNAPGRHFEYWAHEASVMAVEQYPLWRWRMHSSPRSAMPTRMDGVNVGASARLHSTPNKRPLRCKTRSISAPWCVAQK
jgi:uncharacterized protein YcaQ